MLCICIIYITYHIIDRYHRYLDIYDRYRYIDISMIYRYIDIIDRYHRYHIIDMICYVYTQENGAEKWCKNILEVVS